MRTNNKNINLKTLVLVFLIGITFSCNKEILDVENLEAFDSELTWKKESLSNAYLSGLYNEIMPTGWPNVSGPLYGGLNADDIRGVINENSIKIASHPWSGSFENSYSDIRKVNILLQEIEKGGLDEGVKNTIVGQAHFLRAYSYFLLVRVYGGVPLLLKPQSLEDDLEVSRASTAETFDAIIADLDKCIELLDGQTFAEDDKGRIGAAAALAFKSRVLLYKASPMFNPDQPYTNSYWTEAYKAAKTAKDELEGMGFGLVDNYEDIWSVSNEGHQEAILTVKFTEPTKTNGRGVYFAGRLSSFPPVWSLIEKFPMKDGYTVGKSPKYTYKEQLFWKNRDPRFDATIVYNGAHFELEAIKGRRIYTDPKLATDRAYEYSTDISASSSTGLFCKKGIQSELSNKDASQNSVDWIEIRFAEVLLNYAEAANETGKTSEAIEVLKMIRKRAGIEEGTGNYGITATSVEDVREAIYNERAIEFSFEGQRFWDLKRSRKLTALNNQIEKGVAADLKPNFLTAEGILDNDGLEKAKGYKFLPEDFDYKIGTILKSDVSNNKFLIPESYYFAPIPSAQLQKNSKLEQNKDWGGAFVPTL